MDVEEAVEAQQTALANDDWACMLAAVTARLRLAVSEARPSLHPSAAQTLQARVLECAVALEQMHDTLRNTRASNVKAPDADRGDRQDRS